MKKTFEQLVRGDKVYYLDIESGVVVIHSVNTNEHNTLELDITDSGLLFNDFPIDSVQNGSKFRIYNEKSDSYSGIYYSDRDECLKDLRLLINYQINVNKCSIERLISNSNVELNEQLEIKDVITIS